MKKTLSYKPLARISLGCGDHLTIELSCWKNRPDLEMRSELCPNIVNDE